jgi:hypothetical protein
MKPIKYPPRRVLARREGSFMVEDNGFIYLFSPDSVVGSCLCNTRQWREGIGQGLVAQGWKLETPLRV